MYLIVILFVLLFICSLFYLNTKEGITLSANMTDMLPIYIAEDNNSMKIPNRVEGNRDSGTLTFGGDLISSRNVKIDGSNVLEFGKGITKDVNAGKIGYNSLATGSLDIVGAGSTVENRKVYVHDNMIIKNDVTVGKKLTVGAGCTITGGSTITGNTVINGDVMIHNNLKGPGTNGLRLRDKLYLCGSGTASGLPTIDLAIGDNDTGFKWGGDGVIELWANAGKRGSFHSNGLNMVGEITCANVIINSDKRIKKDIQELSPQESLEILRRMKPVKYQFKDTIKEVFGFLAQDMKEVLPTSVSQRKQVIHNIYETCQAKGNILTFATFKTSELAKGTSELAKGKIKVGEDLVQILEILDDSRIKIDKVLDGEVFVYGQEVDDFLSIDQNQLFTVTTSALQALDKQLQEEKQLSRSLIERLNRIEKNLAL